MLVDIGLPVLLISFLAMWLSVLYVWIVGEDGGSGKALPDDVLKAWSSSGVLQEVPKDEVEANVLAERLSDFAPVATRFLSPRMVTSKRLQPAVGIDFKLLPVRKKMLMYGYQQLELDDLARLFAAAFLCNPGDTLRNGMELVVDARSESVRVLKVESDDLVSANMVEFAVNLERIMAGCLRELKTAYGLIDGLMSGKLGRQALELALDNELHVVIALPDVQQLLERQWFGAKLLTSDEVAKMYETKKKKPSIRASGIFGKKKAPTDGNSRPTSPSLPSPSQCSSSTAEETPALISQGRSDQVNRKKLASSESYTVSTMSPPPSPPDVEIGGSARPTINEVQAALVIQTSVRARLSDPSKISERANRAKEVAAAKALAAAEVASKAAAESTDGVSITIGRIITGIIAMPFVAIWPPLERSGRNAGHTSWIRIFDIPPFLRFWAFELSNLTYVLMRTFNESPVKRGTPDPFRDWFFCIWSCAQFIKVVEFFCFVGLGRFLNDPHNVIELVATVLSLSSNWLAVCNYEDWPVTSNCDATIEGHDCLVIGEKPLWSDMPGSFGTVWSYCSSNDVAPLAAQEFLAFAVFFRWLNLVPRMLQRHEIFGPLMLSCRVMVIDMVRWIVLAMWVNITFLGFFNAIYKEPYGVTDDPEGCTGDDDFDHSFESPATVFVWLLEVTVGNGGNFACLRQSSVGEFAEPMFILFLLVQMVMLMNMLIAMMADTFAKVGENSRNVFLYLKALQVHVWLQYPPVPPPLNLLSLPYFFIIFPLRTLWVFLSQRKAASGAPTVQVSTAVSETLDTTMGDAHRKSLQASQLYGSMVGGSMKVVGEVGNIVEQTGSVAIAATESKNAISSAVFKLPDDWKQHHDVDSILVNAVKFGREDEIQSEELAKQVFALHTKFDALQAELQRQERERAFKEAAGKPSKASSWQAAMLAMKPRAKGIKGLIEQARKDAAAAAGAVSGSTHRV